MDIDATFKPVAVELIDNVFPTDVVYHQTEPGTYDFSTGAVAPVVTDYSIKAGVLSRGRTEEGGVEETNEIRIWIQHSASGLPVLPKTGDTFTYDSLEWKVVSIDPTYSSKGLIASKLTARTS